MNTDIGIIGNERLEALQGRIVMLAFVIEHRDVKLVTGEVFQAFVDVIGRLFGIERLGILFLKLPEIFQGLTGDTLVAIDRIHLVEIAATDLVKNVGNCFVVGVKIGKLLIRKDGIFVFFEVIVRIGDLQLRQGDVLAERIPVFDLLKILEGRFVIPTVIFIHALLDQYLHRFDIFFLEKKIVDGIVVRASTNEKQEKKAEDESRFH